MHGAMRIVHSDWRTPGPTARPCKHSLPSPSLTHPRMSKRGRTGSFPLPPVHTGPLMPRTPPPPRTLKTSSLHSLASALPPSAAPVRAARVRNISATCWHVAAAARQIDCCGHWASLSSWPRPASSRKAGGGYWTAASSTSTRSALRCRGPSAWASSGAVWRRNGCCIGAPPVFGGPCSRTSSSPCPCPAGATP